MKIAALLLLALSLSLCSCDTTTPAKDPYSGHVGKNGTSNNMGDGPSNAFGNTAGMTGQPRTPSY